MTDRAEDTIKDIINNAEEFNDAAEIKSELPRSYENLVHAIHVLGDGEIDNIEAIIAEAGLLPPLKRDLILKALKNKTKINLGTMRDQLKSGVEREKPDHLDLADATLDEIGRESVLCAASGLWKWNNNGVWKQVEDRGVKLIIQNKVKVMGEHVIAAEINSVLDVLKTETFHPEHMFNLGNPETVNCLNGEIELIDGSWILLPHKRENYRTTQIPINYDPSASAPRFVKFLEEVFRGDPDKDDKIKALLEAIGYTLMSHARYEKFVILIGGGANGKSVLLAVLEGLCGVSNVAGVQPSKFDSSFQRAHLHNKLANIISELKQGEVIADAELKAIVSGEASTVEHKFKDPFELRPYATCWFGTNHMPHTKDFSDALFRRAIIVPFNQTFSGHQQDPNLKDKLQQELSGILNMALEAYAHAIINGFTDPTSSLDAKKEWRLEADQVAQFVEECCERKHDGEEPMSVIYVTYKTWAQEQGINKPVSQKTFRDRLTRLGFGNKRTSKDRRVTGIWLK
jgi:putative DNA primase/helicase